MSPIKTLIGGVAVAALCAPAFADQTDFSFPVHDIIITSNIPMVHISVRNMSNSTDPADRDLRVVSSTPVIPVSGQVWCKSYNHAENDALRAQIMFGSVTIASSQNGADPLMLTYHSESDFDTFSGTHNLENFQIDAELNFPNSFDRHALVNLDPFNPVRIVENRMEHFVDNNAGSEADFMRVDDVFETQISLSAVGWCGYESNNTSGEYAGARIVPVNVSIFYHGDEDIQDVIQTVGGANTVAAQTPSRARATTTTRGPAATPPARNSRPARARSDNDEQRAYRGGVRVATGDVNGDGRKVADTPKQQVGRGRTRSRADVSPAQASSTEPVNDRLDNDSDGAAAALLLPAVQSAREASNTSSAGATGQSRRRGGVIVEDLNIRQNAQPGVEPDEIDAPAQANTGLEPDEIDAPARVSALDALRVINRAINGGETAGRDSGEAHLDYLSISSTTLANAGVEPDEIDAPAQAADAEPQDAFMYLTPGRARRQSSDD